MVCIEEESSFKVTLQDDGQSHEPTHITLTPMKTIDEIFKEVSDKFDSQPDELEIVIKAGEKELRNLSELKEKTLYEADLWPVDSAADYELLVTRQKKNMSLSVSDALEDDLLLGASASPTTREFVTSYPEFEFKFDRSHTMHPIRRKPQSDSVIAESPTYVGLVNQAMTCYLNSLLQALFMTPEFRNALYIWKFDGKNETRSIPFQLQKLFLNLQTSGKTAVETTDLTTSFGWQGSDAWHQHDIQELCRVMFDALEQKFKSTTQANLINDLYEGKMLDYVKCLECQTEKSREDTFLDIPLPVRPFGSSVAYNSVEEALRAFVQPETLDGNNQYFCEKCDKKCDAHKGLKFIKFPYLLTLHLKRFDFDYNTMHRIKLNDKVVFPEKLNLNTFITATARADDEPPPDEREAVVKCDECSTADSGSADDESCQGTDMSSTINGQDDNCGDSDEGIDVSSGTNHRENDAKGPYVYELFSIMIHSGSASGGHYYAYIKDFDKARWYCFNDQTVGPITEDDIKKTYGGGPQRGYYSGVYSSSTNAYMLMYRQIDGGRNARAMTVAEFPPHIEALLRDMRDREERDRLNRQKEDEMVKIGVVCTHPVTNNTLEMKISTFMDSTLAELARHAHSRFKLDNVVDPQDCRIVMYNKKSNCIDCSFDSDETKLNELVRKVDMIFYTEWMLEIREPGTPWKVYKRGGVNVKVYPVNVDAEDVDEPFLVRVDIGETFGEFRRNVGELLGTDADELAVVYESFNGEPRLLVDDDEVVKLDYNCPNVFYVARLPSDHAHHLARLKSVAARYEYVIGISVTLPDTDESTLEMMSIPMLDLNRNVDRDAAGSPGGGGGGGGAGDGYDQSNSEDSLSDSDRTLIGDAPDYPPPLSSSSPSSATDQHMSSPSDPCQDTYNYDVMGRPGEEMHWDYSETAHRNYVFKVTSVVPFTNHDADEPKRSRCCKILVDKRMSLGNLKKHLEPVLRVPSEYFKVYKQHPISEEEWYSLNDTLRSIKDGERLSLRLDRVLKEDEHSCKIYHLKLDNADPNCFLFEHVMSKDQTVGAVKWEILAQAKKRGVLDIPFERCRLREKNWKKPRKVYLDDQKFDSDITIMYPFELFLQELAEPECVTSENQVVVFTRRWSPSTLTLGPLQEVVLDVVTLADLRTKISTQSGIPKESLDLTCVKPNFPSDMHVLEIDDDLDWNPNGMTLSRWEQNIDDGSLFFYKDSREEPKELTRDERKEIKQKEDARLGRFVIKNYSPGRERALKIYLDTSPSKTDDCRGREGEEQQARGSKCDVESDDGID
ncbi:ubiquitin carboxyl-terminal hydrolase 47 [Cylas formicarius]|uniref:ubiquitin carboxyl-terminal hydrolase 47 n=1 Tax=Cylas formicarius TaxID=197179 RepID=UPI0029588DCC|nr:ubiquitin carboxyl-terminal hydrolase 47 [Cylas formicarius]XP_060519422.1 ubiquitin carboxyl-terminal hydrolase 47 [Cylas formicarius]XP_060519423.1 ubiquitin carboxyl-terminal hydrolase 47 [Cylas formicarius]XP_060519424.1 ubiquitin carboxyl-terminal hydrolase 47 [Cylas formicarius]